jgi:sugar phosphate isomerase/epimerase
MMNDTKRMCIHTITTKPWPIETAIEKFSCSGVAGITVWRDALEGRKIGEVRRRIADAGMAVVSLCRGGFFPAVDAAERKKRIADNLRAIEEAAELGAPHVVLVCGADPRQPLEESRRQIREGIEAVLPAAEANKVRLAIEPLHPMYADTRSAVNTLKQANDLCDAIARPAVGVAVDVYHLWWDPVLEAEIARSGRAGRIFAFHVCDWKSPTTDFLNDRGLMGEGCIDIPKIRGWVEKAGFLGFVEVEIFSNIYWSTDQDEFLGRVVEAYKKHV